MIKFFVSLHRWGQCLLAIPPGACSCLPKLRTKFFTSAAVENCSQLASKEAFYGTGISLIEHRTFNGRGIN